MFYQPNQTSNQPFSTSTDGHKSVQGHIHCNHCGECDLHWELVVFLDRSGESEPRWRLCNEQGALHHCYTMRNAASFRLYKNSYQYKKHIQRSLNHEGRVCKYCGVDGLRWAHIVMNGEENAPIWRLCDQQNYVHSCTGKDERILVIDSQSDTSKVKQGIEALLQRLKQVKTKTCGNVVHVDFS